MRSALSRLRFRVESWVDTLPLIGRTRRFLKRRVARLTQKDADDYVRMQKREYERGATADQVSPGVIDGDYVVGSWRAHNAWADYRDFLMRYVPESPTWVALDFGCGPGRNLHRWSERFRRIDGVDISEQNLKNARVFLSELPAEKTPRLFVTSGKDCGEAPAGEYDFVFSTICLQHICVHSVRYSIFESLFRCLRPGGRLSVQMGYGVPSPNSAGYHEDHVQAMGTNRVTDVAIASPDEPRADLEKIGFKDFEYWLRPTGPGDTHLQWIFFTAVKPSGSPA